MSKSSWAVKPLVMVVVTSIFSNGMAAGSDVMVMLHPNCLATKEAFELPKASSKKIAMFEAVSQSEPVFKVGSSVENAGAKGNCIIISLPATVWKSIWRTTTVTPTRTGKTNTLRYLDVVAFQPYGIWYVESTSDRPVLMTEGACVGQASQLNRNHELNKKDYYVAASERELAIKVAANAVKELPGDLKNALAARIILEPGRRVNDAKDIAKALLEQSLKSSGGYEKDFDLRMEFRPAAMRLSRNGTLQGHVRLENRLPVRAEGVVELKTGVGPAHNRKGSPHFVSSGQSYEIGKFNLGPGEKRTIDVMIANAQNPRFYGPPSVYLKTVKLVD